MELSEIEKTTLKWVTDYYQATKRIRQKVCDDLGREISDGSFATALLWLHTSELVTAHLYDNQAEEYVIYSSPTENLIYALYWLATEKAEKNSLQVIAEENMSAIGSKV